MDWIACGGKKNFTAAFRRSSSRRRRRRWTGGAAVLVAGWPGGWCGKSIVKMDWCFTKQVAGHQKPRRESKEVWARKEC